MDNWGKNLAIAPGFTEGDYLTFVDKCKQAGVLVCESPEYHAWEGFRQRCSNPNNKRFKNYGGRGIQADPRYDNFKNFFLDVGPRPGREYSLDRQDPRRHYEPGNLFWRTINTQSLNKLGSVLYTFRGEIMSIRQIARAAGLNYSTLQWRLKIKHMRLHEAVQQRPWNRIAAA